MVKTKHHSRAVQTKIMINKFCNSTPYSMKIHKRSVFREKIQELLLNFLRSEDGYVEVSRLGNCSLLLLVYSIYCTVVSSLLFSPSIDKPCTCNNIMFSAPRASISLEAICGWESNAISYISNFQ